MTFLIKSVGVWFHLRWNTTLGSMQAQARQYLPCRVPLMWAETSDVIRAATAPNGTPLTPPSTSFLASCAPSSWSLSCQLGLPHRSVVPSGFIIHTQHWCLNVSRCSILLHRSCHGLKSALASIPCWGCFIIPAICRMASQFDGLDYYNRIGL